MKINTDKIEYHIREILMAIGEDPTREGLVQTPARVAKMYAEVFAGIQYTNQEIADMYNTTFFEDEFVDTNHQNYVIVRDIEIFSYCEHHLALMYNMKVSVIYRPNENVIGLSKIARIAEMVSKRLQLQERIGADIAEIVSLVASTKNVGVYIEGEHSCMTSRGVKKPGTLTSTTTFLGEFKTNHQKRMEALALLRK